jgi:cell division protease FtsH
MKETQPPNRSRALLVTLAITFLVAIGIAILAPGQTPTTATPGAPQRAKDASQPAPKNVPDPSSTYSGLVRAMENHEVTSVVVDGGTGKATVLLDNGLASEVVLPVADGELLRQLTASGATVTVKEPHTRSGSSIVSLIAPFVILALLFGGFFLISRRRAKGGAMLGGGMFDTGLRKSAEVDEVPPQRFADVAGCDEAVEELEEVVAFFHDPSRFEHLGAKLPSGIMLHGEPGTGKTLLAKALAGEAGIPFFATSGSDFVEKFVGVGASRVRELFAKARKHPEGAVIFIDEIDAVGRARGGTEANSEREQTLNQILVELDGFSTTDRIVCVAATNRLDVLDPALLRPGRFGRHIGVPLPSAPGRAAILRVHAEGKPLADDVDLDDLATSMGGLSGAQLAEVTNEAAIMAGRGGSFVIRRAHFREAFLRVLAGPKRRSAPIAEGELEVIACHEAGHVLCAEYGEHYEKAQQVTVEPRGQAMGLAVYGQVDRALHDPEYLHEALMATLAGRAAEQIVFGRVSSGAANDLQKATELARRAVEELGFSERLGQIVAGRAPFSETTRAIVDSEIERMVADAYADALDVLAGHRDQLDRLRDQLVRTRELERVDILAAIGRVEATAPGRRRQAARKGLTALRGGLPLAAAEGPAESAQAA